MQRVAFGCTFGVVFALALAACGEPPAPKAPAPPANKPAGAPAPPPAAACAPGAPMRIHFYDAGQGLAALVMLPDGRRILVDTGESPSRPKCGDACAAWHERVMSGLGQDLGGARLDLLWITHPHSDHLGGVPDVLAKFGARAYVDNGKDLEKPAVKAAREAVSAAKSELHVVDPEHASVPMKGDERVRFSAIVPHAWAARCATDPNACSLALRIDYCRSSVLFTGDAPKEEEETFDLGNGGEVTLLQVGHHGSATATGEEFVTRANPKYAVVSSAKPDEGTNDGYCHPRKVVLETLTKQMGGAGKRTVRAYDGGARCEQGTPKPDHWVDVPVSDGIWTTARDGDVRLVTTGDGTFTKE